MPKYALARVYAPTTTRAQIDGMALAGLATLQNYIYRGGDHPLDSDHGIRWLRSYWQPGGTWGVCLYEAPDLDMLRDFQDLCGMPFVSVREVEEINGTVAPLVEQPLLAAEFTASQAADPAAVTLEAAQRAGESSRLLRVYWDHASGLVTALFSTDHGDDALNERLTDKTVRVVEISPGEYD